MNQISFKNFRRFQTFNPIEFNGITFLVGRNNSGKSTVVKAILLVIDYLKSDNVSKFSLSPNNVEDVNIVTFGRALNKQAFEGKDDLIEMNLKINSIEIKLSITGQYDKTEADVIYLEINDLLNTFSFKLRPQLRSINLQYTKSENDNFIPEYPPFLTVLERKKNTFQKRLKSLEDLSSKSSPEFIQANDELEQLKKKISDIKKQVSAKLEDESFSLDYFYTSQTLSSILNETIKEHSYNHRRYHHETQRKKISSTLLPQLNSYKFNLNKINTFIGEITDFQQNVECVYLGASLQKQSGLFAIRDKHNPLAQAIHEFKQLGIYNDLGCDAVKFIRKWGRQEEFELGDDFEIIMHGGEAYEVNIFSYGLKIPLADKGTGAIQVALLILRLAIIIHKKQAFDRLHKISKPAHGKQFIVFLEEPELNLHPAFQSKLADLFLDVYQNYSIQFLIETHSEYILRRSQVIVAESEFEVAPNENPYCVHYFPKNTEHLPYRLNYLADGTFEKSFGKGFFDEAASSTLELLKIKRQKK